MKKVLLALLLVSTMAFSDGVMFRQGTNAINAGINLNFNTYDGVRPGILAVYDRGAFWNWYSLGVEVGFYNDSRTIGDWKYSYNYVSPLVRFGFHPFGLSSLDGKVKAAAVIDPYAVIAVGPTFSSWSWEEIDGKEKKDSSTNFTWAFKPGIRWYFNSKVNFWAEGWWNSLTLGAGISF